MSNANDTRDETAPLPEERVRGTIASFKGNRGYIVRADGKKPDVFLQRDELMRSLFPIPKSKKDLVGLEVEFEIKAVRGPGGHRAEYVTLIGEPTYELALPPAPDKIIYTGRIIHFGGEGPRSGDGYGFVRSDRRGIKDAIVGFPILRENGFPIPEFPRDLNGMRVRYTFFETSKGPRVSTIKPEGAAAHPQEAWKTAGPEVAVSRNEDIAPRDLPENQTVQGTVKTYFPERGYGFIVPDNGGKEVFVHVKNTPRPLVEGEKIVFNRTRDGGKVVGQVQLESPDASSAERPTGPNGEPVQYSKPEDPEKGPKQ